MPRQRLYNGVRLLGEGPSPRNVARLDFGAFPMIHAMRSRGIQIDPDHFAKMDKVLTLDMERLESEIEAIAGRYINLSSSDQIAQLLFKDLGLKQARIKLTKSGDRESTDKDVLTAIQHTHIAVAKIVAYRKLDKLRGTYVRPIPKLAKRTAFGTWRLFPNFKTTRIPSGRFAAEDPNLLAMPNRTKEGQEVCKGFITDPGWCFLSVDESQIEPRTVAHRSGDRRLMAIYENREDIYSDFAIGAFKLPDTRHEDKEGWHYPSVHKKNHRFPAKTCILASIYRVTGVGLLEQMPVICEHCNVDAANHKEEDCTYGFRALWNEDNCTDLINAFYVRYPAITHMQHMDDARAKRFGYVWCDWGRLLHTTAVRSVHKWVVSAALREAGNMPIQCIPASTRILTSEGYRRIGEFKTGSVWTGERWAPARRIDKGLGDLVKVSLMDGAEFVCDTAHKLLVSRTPWPEWTPVTQLVAGDTMPSSLTKAEGGSTEEDPEFWYWVGRHYGDGHITVDKSRYRSEIAYAFGPSEIGEVVRLCNYVKSRGHTRPHWNEQVKPGGGRSIRVGSSTFHRDMLPYGVLPNEYSWDKRVPNHVFTLDYERRLAFVTGYYDADGSGVPRYYAAKRMWSQRHITSVCLGLLQDTQILYRSLGVFTRIMGPYRQGETKHRQFYRLVIDEREHSRKIKSVELLGTVEKVYTLRVEDPRHAYDSEGLISKNSFAGGTLKLTMAAVQDDLTSIGMYKDVWYPLLPIHDEILSEVREDVAQEIGEHIADRFKNSVQLTVPLAAEYATAPTWGALVK